MKQLSIHVKADNTDLCFGFLSLEQGLGNNFTCEPSFSRILDLECMGKASFFKKAHTSKVETMKPSWLWTWLLDGYTEQHKRQGIS